MGYGGAFHFDGWNDDEIAASSLLAAGRKAHGRREVSGFGRRVWIRINFAAGFAELERMAIGGALRVAFGFGLALLGISAVGCGGSGGSGGGGSPGTTPGTYTVTVTASAQGASQTQTLTVMVTP